MKTSTWAKVFGWVNFALQYIGQASQGGGFAPHGWAGWLGLLGSGAVAVAVHAASGTDGTK